MEEIDWLKARHGDLDNKLAEHEEAFRPDYEVIKMIKREKLHIKDNIDAIERQHE